MSQPTMKLATQTTGYLVTFSMMALLRHGSRERVLALAPGKILIPESTVDAAGMIDATCNGHHVQIFQRDLMERAERIPLKPE